MSKHEVILKHQLFGEPVPLQKPVKEVHLWLTQIPELFYPPNGPKQFDRGREIRRWKGTSTHDHVERKLASESRQTAEAFFPTLPEAQVLDIKDDLLSKSDPEGVLSPIPFYNIPPSSVRDQENPQQQYLISQIPIQEKTTVWEVAIHGLRTSQEYAEKIRKALPSSGSVISETTMLFRLGNCSDGYQVVLHIKPDIIKFVDDTIGNNTAQMVTIHDLKNFPLRKKPGETDIDFNQLQRQLTIAAFANVRRHAIANAVRRKDKDHPFTDFDRLFKDSDGDVKERMRNLRHDPYSHFDGSHQEIHISSSKGFETDEISMNSEDVITFLSSLLVHRLVSLAKKDYKARERQKTPSERAKGSKTRFVTVTDAVLRR